MSSEKGKTILGYILECFSLLDEPEKLIRATDLLLNIINTEIEFLESMKKHVINLKDVGKETKNKLIREDCNDNKCGYNDCIGCVEGK